MNLPHVPALTSLYNFIRHLRSPFLIGAIALLVGLLTLAKDLKMEGLRTSKPAVSSKTRDAAPRKTAVALTRNSVPLSPLLQAAGPVAGYGFSESTGATTVDASGNGNTGTMVGGVTRVTTGKFGNAMSFDGNTGVVRTLDSPTWKVSGLTGYTISIWVKVNSAVGDYKAVIGKGGWPASDLLINKLGVSGSFVCGRQP